MDQLIIISIVQCTIDVSSIEAAATVSLEARAKSVDRLAPRRAPCPEIGGHP